MSAKQNEWQNICDGTNTGEIVLSVPNISEYKEIKIIVYASVGGNYFCQTMDINEFNSDRYWTFSIIHSDNYRFACQANINTSNKTIRISKSLNVGFKDNFVAEVFAR